MTQIQLTPELQAKVKNCKTPEELLTLAREEGYELSDEELEAVNVGSWSFFDELKDLIDGCDKYEINILGARL